NTATVTEYYATDKKDDENEGGENLGPVEDDATIRVTAERSQKYIVSTSESDTEGTNVAIGEIVRFRLAAHVPEGVAKDFKMRDELPDGLLFLNDRTATAALVSNDEGLTSSELTHTDLLIEG